MRKSLHRILPVMLGLFVAVVPIGSASQEPFPKGAPPLDWVLPAVQAPRLQYRVLDSPSAHSKVSYQVYTPERYDKECDRRFPVLYWLHGSGGGGSGIQPLAKRFDDAIRARKIAPMIIVFPNGLRNGMWCDSKDGRTPVETIFMNELIPAVDATFRTIASRAGRLIEGFSMGGYGAARLGFKHPGVFKAISILGGGPLQRAFKETPRASPRAREWIMRSVYGADQVYFRAQSPWALAERHAAALSSRITIRQIVGDRDETLPANRELDAHLTRLNIPHAFRVLPGIAHNPRALLNALGDTNWAFYRDVFGNAASSSDNGQD